MRLGTATQLACELTPYALVALVVSTAALGAPLLAPLGAAVALAMVANAALGRCDLATWFLGDAPRSAYDGATVWITGASQGLGEALALHLASLGARLILSSRREETLRRVCDACEAAGARAAVPLVLDARAGSPAMRAKGAEALEIANRWAEARADPSSKDRKRKGLSLDYVFHVAGGSQHAAAEDTADEVDRDMFELNVLSAIALTKAVLPAMLERRAGAFCVVGSMAAKCPAPGQATYAATKAALAAFFHSLRGEVADRGLTVTVAHPGPIATGLDGQTRVVFGATLESTPDGLSFDFERVYPDFFKLHAEAAEPFSLKRVMAMGRADFLTGSNQALARAQAYTLVHFLIFGEDEKYLSGFGAYLRDAYGGQGSETHLRKALDLKDTKELEQAWHAYAREMAGG